MTIHSRRRGKSLDINFRRNPSRWNINSRRCVDGLLLPLSSHGLIVSCLPCVGVERNSDIPKPQLRPIFLDYHGVDPRSVFANLSVTVAKVVCHLDLSINGWMKEGPLACLLVSDAIAQPVDEGNTPIEHGRIGQVSRHLTKRDLVKPKIDGGLPEQLPSLTTESPCVGVCRGPCCQPSMRCW